jgi:hypothetical protein
MEEFLATESVPNDNDPLGVGDRPLWLERDLGVVAKRIVEQALNWATSRACNKAFEISVYASSERVFTRSFGLAGGELSAEPAASYLCPCSLALN